MNARKLEIQCAIFDMDGTLTVEHLDFAQIRIDMGVPDGSDLLHWLDTLDDSQRKRAEDILLRHEIGAACAARAADGAIEAVEAVKNANIKCALLTRNTKTAMEIVLDRLSLSFDLCFSREDGPIKPEPESIFQACGILGVSPEKSVCVGDWVYDIEAANAAGCVSVLLTRGRELDFADIADYTIESMTEFAPLLGL